MKIGILITSIGNFGQKGFYNTQEIGLAKELDKLFNEVIIYKAIPFSKKKTSVNIEGCNHSVLHQVPVKNIGNNGIWDCTVMDDTLDALVYFSDTQLAVPEVYKWCYANQIILFPYIGVVASHSTNKIKRVIINFLFKENIRVYKKCTCFVKTPSVGQLLEKNGIKDCIVLPVGLDLSLLRADYKDLPVDELKTKRGYLLEDKVVLFIGRMTEEKQPFRMLSIFSKVFKTDKSYRLLMVGKGEQLEGLKKFVYNNQLEDVVKFIEQIPNEEIWELYRIAECFVNLNQQEIFGMVILEAMYYGCRVVAWKAPGPSFIIEDGVSGLLAESNEEVIVKIIDSKLQLDRIHNRVMDSFTWEYKAALFYKHILLLGGRNG